MKRKFRIALLAVPVLAGITAYTFLGSRCAAAFGPDEPGNQKNEIILDLTLRVLSNSHYRPLELNDEFSHKAFDTYLKRSDFNKKMFLQSDVDELKGKYYDKIDDELRARTFDFFDRSVQILNERIGEDKKYYTDILSQPFDFSERESVELDPEKLKYATDKTAMKESWRQYLKYQTMVRYIELKEEQDKAVEEKKPDLKIKKDTTLEREARMKVLKTQSDIFDRLAKVDRDDRMSVYLNVVTGLFDPHSEFYPPADKANFDIAITGQLEGIGATLQEKDGYIKVASIVPGSPSWKQGQLKAGDLILKVGQGDKEPVDIVGMRVDEAVKLIRGKKGTEVRLTVQKPDGTNIVIPIIRDIVILEETFAQSAIIDQQKKVGYIRLPSFYADFTKDRSGKHTSSEDVRRELEKLKAENVSGVILDLRDNGGGSLMEVIRMMGLFIPQGPVVQVQTRNQGKNIYDDKDEKVVYDGPLVVLVNENSASASEILAAAIQDYKRGVVIGSASSTFGKGTVQNFYNLDEIASNNAEEMMPLGEVKVTIQKFYRINGGSTQLKGVVPDIVLPGYYSFDEQGEKDLDFPMEWDQIPAATYSVWRNAPNFEKVKKTSAERVAKSGHFLLITDKSKQLKRERDNSMESLYLPDYEASKARLKDENKKFKPLEEPVKGMNVLMLDTDKKTIGSDTAKLARKTDFIDKLKKDPYVSEAAFVVREAK
ncbi:MAG TPA: carboxy terminal-processing peptidase [Bacteroidia bacterium]|nr:carboxy terminal-processing peptidase [Bacteroidia bacterium]